MFTSSASLVVLSVGACDLNIDPAACFSGFKLGSTPLFAPCTGGGAAIPAAAPLYSGHNFQFSHHTFKFSHMDCIFLSRL